MVNHRSLTSVIRIRLFPIAQINVIFICSLFVWVTPSLEQLTWLATIGVLVAMAHISMVQAYKYADISAMEPFVYLRLIWAASIGLLAFGEFPSIWIWVGGVIIVGASSYITRREAKLDKSSSILPFPTVRD